MTERHFTIIVPTRERCDTLEHTLRSCLANDYENLTILVSDNDSRDRTREVVSSTGDSRMVYVNPGKRLDMMNHWEFALSHVHEGYVTIVGDDDGVLPNAVSEINRVIDFTGCDAVAWRKAEYGWPNNIIPEYRDLLAVPVSGKMIVTSSRKVLSDLVRFRIAYNRLPCLYNAVVSTKTIQNVRERTGGRFFASMTPDAYSGIAIAAVTRRYLFSHRPFSVNGASRHSNGVSQMNQALDPAPFRQYLSELTTKLEANLVLCPAINVLVADSLLKAHRALGEPSLKPDLSALVRTALKESRREDIQTFEEVRRAMAEIGTRNRLGRRLLKAVQNACPPAEAVRTSPPMGFLPDENLFRIDGKRANVNNVFDACKLTDYIVNQIPFVVWRHDFRSYAASVAERVLQRLHRSMELKLR
jgi:glycosyltransferase involved in cell wall biosynthesis